MKSLKSRSLVFLSLWLWGATAGASSNERLLLTYYAKHHPKMQAEYLRDVIGYTEKWMKRARLESQVDTFLTMGDVESNFDPTCDDKDIVGPKNNSIGIYQTQRKQMIDLRNWWLARGYELGNSEDIETQCAFGVAEFRIHLDRQRGNLWSGVRHYNGGGVKAYRYASKVFRMRRVIFHRPHVDNERVTTRCPKPIKK